MNRKQAKNARDLMADGAMGCDRSTDAAALDAVLAQARAFESAGRAIPSVIVMQVIRFARSWKGREIPAAIVKAAETRRRVRDGVPTW